MYLNEYQNLLRSAKDMKELCNVITQGTDQYLLKSIEILPGIIRDLPMENYTDAIGIRERLLPYWNDNTIANVKSVDTVLELLAMKTFISEIATLTLVHDSYLLAVYYFAVLEPEWVMNSWDSSIKIPVLVDVISAIEDCYVPNRCHSPQFEEFVASKFQQIAEGDLSLEAFVSEGASALDDYPSTQIVQNTLMQMHMYISTLCKSRPTRKTFFFDACKTAHLTANLKQQAQDVSRFNYYFRDESAVYIATGVKLACQNFFDASNIFFNNPQAVESAFENFKYEIHYKLIPELDRYYAKENSSDSEKRAVYSAFLYEAAKLIDTPDHKIRNYFDSYLPSFNYTGRPYSETSALEASRDDTSRGVKKSSSAKMKDAEKKIYAAYRNYKEKEDAVDNQLTKMTNIMKTKFKGDTRTEIIQGKEFSPIGLLKRALGTAAIFSYNKIAGILYVVVRHATRKNASIKERKKIIMELELEIKMLEEKIEDARGDGNREAKYAMMRTKAELENALKRVKFGLEADQNAMSTASKVLKRPIK